MAILMKADGISGSVTHSGYGPANGQTLCFIPTDHLWAGDESLCFVLSLMMGIYDAVHFS
jgi:hypothetical protein